MEIAQLKQLVVIAETGSISEAATRLGYTQPTLSRSIRRLEKELGCELLKRTKNSVELNDYGRMAVDSAQKILREIDNLKNNIASKKGTSRTVIIATCAPAPLWRVTSELISKLPGIMLGPQVMDEQAIERAVMNQEVNIAITTRPLTMPGVRTRKLMVERLSVAVPKSDELSKKEEVTWDELDGKDFIILSDIGIWNEFSRKYLKHSNVVRQPDRMIFNQLTRTTDRFFFCTDETFQNFPDEFGVDVKTRKILPISEDNSLTFYVSVSISADQKIQSALGFSTE